MASPAQRRYGKISLVDIGELILAILILPFVLAWNLLTVIRGEQSKSWRRVLGDSGFRFLASVLTIRHFQFMLGTTLQVYERWVKQNGLPSLVEEIGDDARLLWIGPKRIDRVIVYFHGGGYSMPLQDFAASFWNHVRLQLKKDAGLDVGLVIFSYSLVPTATFPTQLRQAALALNHVVSSGTMPENIQIVGDSAGGNLILSLLSHTLHPLDGIPRLSFKTRIRGAYLMSPWVSLTGGTGSFSENHTTDIVGADTFACFGREVLAGVAESCYPYLDPSKVSDSWFRGIDGLVERMMISAGGAECLRDDIIELSREISEHHQDMTLVVQKDGVHDDPHFDFLVWEPKLCTLTPKVLAWLAQGFL